MRHTNGKARVTLPGVLRTSFESLGGQEQDGNDNNPALYEISEENVQILQAMGI